VIVHSAAFASEAAAGRGRITGGFGRCLVVAEAAAIGVEGQPADTGDEVAVGDELAALPLRTEAEILERDNPAGWNNLFGFRTSFGRVPADGRDAWLPSMGVLGPMARNVPDLAMLLSVQAGYDPRVPLSLTDEGSVFADRLDTDLKGKRIAWVGDFNGYVPYEPDVLNICKRALKTFEQLGCVVEEALPDFPIDTVWRAWLRLRAWQNGGTLLPIIRIWQNGLC
jgi:Amidase